jgi:hypothetical protein
VQDGDEIKRRMEMFGSRSWSVSSYLRQQAGSPSHWGRIKADEDVDAIAPVGVPDAATGERLLSPFFGLSMWMEYCQV